MVETRSTSVTVSLRFFDPTRQLSDKQIAVWSNFEIADMSFWRGEAYTKFFDYLDATGGFYYEVRKSLFLTSTWLLTEPV